MTYKEALQIYKDTCIAWGGFPDECDESKSERVKIDEVREGEGRWMWKIYYKDKEGEQEGTDYFYIQG